MFGRAFRTTCGWLWLPLFVFIGCGSDSSTPNQAPSDAGVSTETSPGDASSDAVQDGGSEARPPDAADDASNDGGTGLSPADWPAGELETFTEKNKDFPTSHPPEQSDTAMIAGTSNALAVRSGYEALARGGTAADAAVTTALSQVVLAAGSYVSAAGIFFCTYYDASTGEVSYLNAGFDTPLGELDPMTIPASGPSGRTALVPGFVAGIQALHDRFGALPFASTFEPAIYFADEGFELNYNIGHAIDSKQDVLGRLPETKAIFTDDSGNWYTTGDWFRQPVLADTLETIAQQGASYVYEGTWAERFVAAVQADGGTIEQADMDAYEVIWSEPAQTTYRDYTIWSAGLPSLGGVNTVEAFNVFEAADLTSMGDPTESAEALFWYAQIHRLYSFGFFDESALQTIVPGVDLSPESRLTKATAQQLWSAMVDGNVPFVATPSPSTHSDAIVVVDAQGNVAAITHTINTAAWGDTGIFVDGISISDAAWFQQARMAETGPGNRLPEETNPTIVLEGDEPVLASSSIGVVHQRTLSVLYPLLTYDVSIAPAFEHQGVLWPDFTDFTADGIVEQVLEGSYDATLLDDVRALGLSVSEIPEVSHHSYRGYWVGIQKKESDGSLEGMTSMYLNGAVVGM